MFAMQIVWPCYALRPTATVRSSPRGILIASSEKTEEGLEAYSLKIGKTNLTVTVIDIPGSNPENRKRTAYRIAWILQELADISNKPQEIGLEVIIDCTRNAAEGIGMQSPTSFFINIAQSKIIKKRDTTSMSIAEQMVDFDGGNRAPDIDEEKAIFILGHELGHIIRGHAEAIATGRLNMQDQQGHMIDSAKFASAGEVSGKEGQFVFKHLTDNQDIEDLSSANKLKTSDNWRDYCKAIDSLEEVKGQISPSALYQVSICLQELEANSLKFSEDRQITSQSRLYQLLSDAGETSHILQIVFLQRGVVKEREWAMLKRNLDGYARAGVDYLLNKTSAGERRIKEEHYENEARGFETVGRLMALTSVVLNYRKVEAGLETSISIKLDNLFGEKLPSVSKEVDLQVRSFIIESIGTAA